MPTSISRILRLRLPWKFYRYISGEVIRPFLGTSVFFLFVLMMFQVIRLVDFFVGRNVSGYSILSLMGYLSLTFTPIIFPIGFLLAVLMGFGRLSTDGEVLAMRAAGVSVYSMLAPVMGLGILLSVITMFCNFYFVPYGARMFRYEFFRISNTKAIATIHPGTFTTEDFFNLILYADEVDFKKNTLKKVLIYDEREKSLPITVVAHDGKIINNLQDQNGVPGLMLRLFDGSLHRGDPAKNIYEKTKFDIYDIFLRIETSKVIGVDVPKTMDVSTLRQRLNEIKEKMKAGKLTDISQLSRDERLDYINFGVEYWKRFALSFSCIIFALMGVAFGVVRTRTVRSNSFLICLLVLLFYWVIYSAGHNLASDGKIPAIVGMWTANIVLLFIALFALRRAAK
jgi:lipopolysaccharide export system permease protein